MVVCGGVGGGGKMRENKTAKNIKGKDKLPALVLTVLSGATHNGSEREESRRLSTVFVWYVVNSNSVVREKPAEDQG